jgi:hypothetical protein
MEMASLLFKHEITLGGLDQGSYPFVADLTQSSHITAVNNNDDISPPPQCSLRSLDLQAIVPLDTPRLDALDIVQSLFSCLYTRSPPTTTARRYGARHRIAQELEVAPIAAQRGYFTGSHDGGL